jgi:RNA ligase (TIGR02306 family)
MFLNDEIISIEEISCNSLRYDITVEDNNNFFANDILVHNCQNITNELSHLVDHTYEVTEKLEGSSCQFGRIDGEFLVLSRNLNLAESDGNSMWQQVRKYDVEQKMIKYNMDNLMIQTEIIGEGIQGNHYGIKGQDIYVFAVYDTNRGQFVSPEVRNMICHQLQLKHVPVIGQFPLSAIITLGDTVVGSILEYADGNSLINKGKLREGVVFKRVDGQEHFKAVSNAYLLGTNN